MRSARTSGSSWVVLDRDPAAKRRLQRALIGARHRAPAHRVEKRIKLGGVVHTIGRDHRELGTLDHARRRLDLPDHLQLLARRVVLESRSMTRDAGPAV